MPASISSRIPRAGCACSKSTPCRPGVVCRALPPVTLPSSWRAMSSPVSVERSKALSAAYIAACELELRALKPGNVHDFAAGHGMTVDDFAASAEVSAGPLCRPGASVGERILGAIRATRERVGCNTNLGIVLLAAPLVAAAEHGIPP